MEYRRLGRTELQVSAIALGSGGPNRFGQRNGVPEADIARTVVLVQSGIPLVSGVRRVVIEGARKVFLSIYLKEYFRITSMMWDEVTPWLLPVAVHYVNSVFPEHLPDQLAYTRQFV